MNVSCQQCKTVFRIDQRKVPSGGVRARCSVCGGVFEVGASGHHRPAPVGVAAPPGAAVGVAPAAQPTPPRAPAPVQPTTPPPAMAPPASMAPPPPAMAPPPAMRPPPAMAPPPAMTPPPPPVQPPPTAVPQPLPTPQATPTPAEPAAPPARPFGQPDPESRARRLARALISDLAAYNPERQQQGLQEGRLKELFKDDLKKSWQEYVEQVGLEMAKGTPYFRDALNEILSKGTRVF